MNRRQRRELVVRRLKNSAVLWGLVGVAMVGFSLWAWFASASHLSVPKRLVFLAWLGTALLHFWYAWDCWKRSREGGV